MSQETNIAHTNAAPEAANAAKRWLALDVFRALAVLWMIQGHTFSALLGSSDALGPLYRLLHGLTAPMFLCGAGLAYGIVTFSAPRPAAPRRLLRRALMLFAIGTLLQLPAAPLSVIGHNREMLAGLLQPAALQLVAACLLLAELLRIATGARLRVRFAAAAFAVAAGVALLAPWLWNFSLSSRYLLGSWIDGQTGAQFPCVPWVCFFLLGAALSALFGASLWRERWHMPLIGVVGFGLSALCYWQFLTGQRLNALYGSHAFWFTSPMFVVFRAGLVLSWLSVLSAASGLLARGFASWPGFARLIATLSRHSLVAYVVHLGMLYGLPPLRSERSATARFSLLECSLICLLVLLVSALSVLHWERLQQLVAGCLRKATRAHDLSAPPVPRGAAPRDPLV